MQALATALLLAAGLVNLLPLGGVLSAGHLESLYGLRIEDGNLLILMRHRAVLFGVVGGLLIASGLHPPLRPLAIAVGLVSMLSFIVIALLVGGYNAELRRVVLVDAIASVALLGAAFLSHLATPR